MCLNGGNTHKKTEAKKSFLCLIKLYENKVGHLHKLYLM